MSNCDDVIINYINNNKIQIKVLEWQTLTKILLKLCLKKSLKFQMNFHPFYKVNIK